VTLLRAATLSSRRSSNWPRRPNGRSSTSSFSAEGLRLREQHGRIHDLDVVGRPDTFTVLAALAAVTEHIGLSGTINSTFNEPFEVARQFASLDHLSNGRAAWNVVTSWDSFTGENFRRGGFLPQEARYDRAKEFLQVARELWDSWDEDAVIADTATGQFVVDSSQGEFEHHGSQFDISGRFNVPRSPQGHPVIFQAGDSDVGREFAAAAADCIFSRHGKIEAGQAFYRDVKGRLAAHGRSHDPDGPLPEVQPDVDAPNVSHGRAATPRDKLQTAAEWRALAEAKKLSIRELMIEVTSPASFVGTPVEVAAKIVEAVDQEAADGFILVPHVTPGGLDEFADTVVPILQDAGRFRREYEGSTLRDHLGLSTARTSSARTTTSVLA
jgi:alkanesulfonate monooxygenase SsuD/methylene tetrahydromethanopterin reductase-like flavin-dependent oxidoreductase (luciferase family)